MIALEHKPTRSSSSGRSPTHVDLAPGLDPDGRTTVLLAPGTAVRVTGGPGPVSVRFG